MTFEDAVGYLASRITFSPKKDRARLLELLAALGNPHEQLRYVHVAGTNGKGSVTTFTAAILQAVGYRVGAYLSPYVFELGERWMVDGVPLAPVDLARHVSELAPLVDTLSQGEWGAITEFELKTAIAFKHFAEVGVDWVVLEVGIGGTLDSTNVIPPPDVAAITSIGFDHVALLGNTLGEIASQKAGILKRGTRACVTPVVHPEARAAIQAKADSEGVPVLTVNGDELPEGVAPGLRGPHQRINASTATVIARTLGIDERAIRAGLEKAFLPGRFQVCRGGRLILDGAHNEEGARTLRAALEAEFPGERFVLVVGFKQSHSPAEFLGPLADKIETVVPTAPAFKPTPVEDVREAAQRLDLPVATGAFTVSEAIHHALTLGPRVVVTGSFYVVGETPASLRGR